MKNNINPSVNILEGRSLANNLIDSLDRAVGQLKNTNIHPHLAVVVVGQNPDSKLFVSLKQKRAQEIGIDFSLYNFDISDTENNIIEHIKRLNNDDDIHGIIVQLPLPEKFNDKKILKTISPNKDVDALNSEIFQAPTASAIWQIIEHYKLPTDNILIIGKGRLVGEPMAKLLDKKAIHHTDWQEKNYDINKLNKYSLIIFCTGQKKLLKNSIYLENSYLIDGSGKDIDFDMLYDCVAGITPSIGGVGPLTIANLLYNTVLAATKKLTL